jgi:hypothetical protein
LRSGLRRRAAVAALAFFVLAISPRAAFALLGTSTSVTSDVNPSVLGQAVTFTATVTGLVVQPSGTVTFKDGATVLGTGTLSGTGIGTSQATFTSATSGPTVLLGGAHSITAVYGGDVLYNASTSPVYTQNVNLSATTTTVNADINPLNLGQLVTLSADVSGCAVTPVGNVTFKNGATTLGTGTLDGAGHAIFTSSSLLTGLLPITAVFAGDSNCAASTSSILNLTVNIANSSTAVVSSQNPSTYTQSVTFTATVSGIVLFTPTGTVTFKDGATTLGTGTLNGAGVATYTTSALAVASHSITAVYGGDTLYTASTSSILTQVVNKAATASAVVSSVNPTSYGGSTTFTATITSTAGTPTGNVTFKDGAATIGTGTLNGAGVTTLAISTLTGGTHSITAIYDGDTNFATSTSSAVSQVVNQNTTTTALVSGTNPSTFGQSVTFTATVSGTSGPPTGTVTFKDGATTLGTGTLNGAGVATYTTSALNVATHSITAVYGGDTNFLTSTSSAVSQVVNSGTTSTALAAVPNPSALSQTVTFTATLSGAGSTPTGTVTFKDGATTLGTGTLNGAGIAAFATGALAAGSHTITAVYGGDSNNSTSTSSPLTQVVNQSATTAALISSVNPSASGDSVTFTATVSGTGGTPTGTVTFKDGVATLGTGTLDGSGQTTFSTSALSTGAHVITAIYAGDTNFIASTSVLLTQNVNANASTTTLISSLNPSLFGQPVTYTGTAAGLAGIPTGTMTFKDGATTLATVPLDGAGQATYTTSSAGGGAHTMRAFYNGNSTYGASNSAPLTQNISQGGSAVALASSSNPSSLGQAITFTATASGTGGTPTGTVTFKDGPATLGTGTLDGTGRATYATSALATGSHSITAVYGGDSNFATATSSTLTQNINAYASTTTLTSSLNPSAKGQSVTFTATASGAGGTPTGTVTFKDGATTLGTRTLSAGAASFATSALAIGAHSITAVYGGDTQYGVSTSAALNQSVGLPLDSLRLRSFQITATKLAAQSAGQAISGAIDAAVAEGFTDDDQFIKPSELGLRMNFSADAPDARRTDKLSTHPAFNDVLKKQDTTGAVSTGAQQRRDVKEWLGWAEVRGTGWSGSNPNADIQGRHVHTLVGVTHKFTPGLLAGVFAGMETFDYTSRSLTARLTGTGMTVGAYAGWRMRPGIRMEASAARTGINYTATAGTAEAQFAATRWVFTGGITGTDRMWGMELEPSARVYYLRENEAGYTDSLGTQQSERTFSTGRASAGMKVTKPLQWSTDVKVAPYAGFYADYYFTADNATSAGAASAVLPGTGIQAEMLQGWSARLASGFGLVTTTGISASLGGELGGLGSGNFSVWSVRGRTSIAF